MREVRRPDPKKKLLILVLMALLCIAVAPMATPQDTDSTKDSAVSKDSPELRAARGRTSYRLYCRNCHGKDGKGDGPIAEVLKVPPADLTALSAAHEGLFPEQEVYEAIDGRKDVRGHGSREMPIWGFSFQDPTRTEDQEAEVRERILDLVEYLKSLQPAN